MGLIDKVNVEVNGSGDLLSTIQTYTTKILKPNIVDGKNILTQAMVSSKNTKYVIKYDYELEEDITIPDNCVLEFDGGSISKPSGSSYYIEGAGAKINHECGYNIFNDVIIKNFNIPYLDIRWFGAIVNQDAAEAFRRAIACTEFNPYIYILVVGEYYINSTINVERDLCLKGSTFRVTEIGRDVVESPTPSRLFVADGVTAFNIIGRSHTVSDYTFTYCQFELDHIYMRGQGTKSATAIYITTSGAPGRISTINHCEFINFKYVIHGKETVNKPSLLGSLNITNTYFNGDTKVIYVENIGEGGISGLRMINSYVEYCDSRAIDIVMFGTLQIEHCTMEGNDTPIVVRGNAKNWPCEISIRQVYFESVTSVENPYAIEIFGNSYTEVILENNYDLNSVRFEKTILSNTQLIGGNSLYSQCIFKHCDAKFITFGNLDVICLFADCQIDGKNDERYSNNTFTDLINGDIYIKGVDVYKQRSDDYAEGVAVPIVVEFLVNPFNNYYIDVDAMSQSYAERHFSFYEVGTKNLLIGNIYLPAASNIAMFDMVYKKSSNQKKDIYYRDAAILSSVSLTAKIADIVASSDAYKIGATKPTLGSGIIGYQFFDTNDNKPYWWNGTAWVDATGQTV